MLRKAVTVSAGVALACGLLAAVWVRGNDPGSTAEAADPSATPRPDDGSARALPALPPLGAKEQASLAKMLTAGQKFLLAQQAADGSFGAMDTTPPPIRPAVTAMAAKALLGAGQPSDSPPLTKALAFIVSKQVADGPLAGAFAEKELANYNTAICLNTLVLANAKLEGKPYDKQIAAGVAFLRRDQWDESEGVNKEKAAYGGFGYGGGQRPDMSNTQTTMDALKALKDAGYLKEDDPMFEKVKVFIQRSQNRTESNDVATIKVTDDGGFFYTPAPSPTRGGPESKAGDQASPDGKSSLRSYGSMTYAGFKSYLYSGLTTEDARVKDAFGWIRKNYTLSENPGVGDQGLFYYYHTFARALRAAGVAKIVAEPSNVSHDWRAELIDALAGMQKPDGSWVNAKAKRWDEGNPVLATCFAMLSLEEATR